MKNLICFYALLLLISCQNETNNQAELEEVETTTKIEPKLLEKQEGKIPEVETNSPLKVESVIGMYVGMFIAEKLNESKKPTWENKINVSIDKVEGGKIIGHSVVAGNSRPFEGTIEPSENANGKFNVIVKEPGDDRYDGVFSFTVDQMNNQISGLWDANDKNLAVSQRSYTLEKTTWEYDPTLRLEDLNYTELYTPYNEALDDAEGEFLTEDVEKKNPSVEKLDKLDVENMHKGDLEVMRNSIYARHGYSFKNRKMRYVFNHVDWYVPMYTDIRENLTTLEKENIALMKRYEQHAERYYDTFGR